MAFCGTQRAHGSARGLPYLIFNEGCGRPSAWPRLSRIPTDTRRAGMPEGDTGSLPQLCCASLLMRACSLTAAVHRSRPRIYCNNTIYAATVRAGRHGRTGV